MFNIRVTTLHSLPRSLRRLWRGAWVIVHVLLGLLLTTCLFPCLRARSKQAWIQWWARRLLRILHVQIHLDGALAESSPQGLLLVANHISWLDIQLIHAVYPARFIAKAEIQQWPIFGWLAKQTGTLFIRRHSFQHTAGVVDRASDYLRQGEILCCFPEGTTSDGTQVLAFKSSLLQAAISAQAPIQPIALCYLDAQGQADRRMAFIGDDALVASIWTVLGVEKPQAKIRFLAPILSQDIQRRALAEQLQQTIQAELQTTSA